VDVSFSTVKLQKLCSSEKAIIRAFGPECAKRLQRRLAELAAVHALADMMALPQARCHALVGGRNGQFAVDLKHPKRLVFEPADDPLPKKDDGGLDLKAIHSVRILEVVDYHG